MTRECPFAEQKMSAKQTKGCPFPEEKVAALPSEGSVGTGVPDGPIKCKMQSAENPSVTS